MQESLKRVGMTALLAAAIAVPMTLTSTETAEAKNGATKRPISDFLQEQTLGDIVDWISFESNTDPSYRARVDFVGVINEGVAKPNGADFGTSFTGSVTEKTRKDGRTDVHVVLHGKKVFYFVATVPTFFPIVSGRLAGANVFGGLSIDTCTTRYDLKYITTNAPGEAMPRLVPLLFNTPNDWEVVQSKLTAQGDCELRAEFGVPDGTRGRFSLNMNGLMHPKGGDITTGDTFPVAQIKLRAVGSED